MSTIEYNIFSTTESVSSNNVTAAAVLWFSSPVPFYGTIILSVTCIILLICCCCWMCKHIRRKKEPKPRRQIRAKSIMPVGLKQEAIQPDMDDLVNSDEDPEEGQSADSVGKLHYSIEYSVQQQILTVMVIEARGLAAMDIGGTSDPYVKVRLLPKKKPTYCTKIIKANCNPLFNETFTFEVTFIDVSRRTLMFYVIDHDAVGADDLIGTVAIPLAKVDLGHSITEWADLVKAGGDGEKEKTPGDVCLSLRYVSAASLLTVVVLEAKNIQLTDEGELPDTVVKLALKIDGKRAKQKKTTVRKACVTPYFNEAFNFDLPFQQIQTVILEVVLAIPGRIRSKRVGIVELGLTVPSAPQVLHWSDMLANPRHPVARWHQFQPIDQDND